MKEDRADVFLSASTCWISSKETGRGAETVKGASLNLRAFWEVKERGPLRSASLRLRRAVDQREVAWVHRKCNA